MNSTLLLLVFFSSAVAGLGADPEGQSRSIGLGEAMRIAMEGSVDVELARIEVGRARAGVASARAERSARLLAGSGLGATSGIPQSVLGAAPSVAHLTVSQPLLDVQQPRASRRARESARASEHLAQSAAERSAYDVGVRYLEFELASLEEHRRLADVSHFAQLERIAEARVEEGIAVPLTLAGARLETARARERHAAARSRARLLEAELGHALAMDPSVRLVPAGLDAQSAARLEAAASSKARDLDAHPEVAALAAQLTAAQLRVEEARAERLPKLDIVAQYAVLARFNNYDDYFRRFQRHNLQAGVAVRVPLFAGRTVAAAVARARLDERDVLVRHNAKRAALALERRRSDEALQEAERRNRLAAQELEYARARLDVALAQFDEGRVGLESVLRDRVAESAAWGERMAARFGVAIARLAAVYSSGRISDVLAD